MQLPSSMLKLLNKRFTDAGSRCRQHLKNENFASPFDRQRQKIIPKSVPHVQHNCFPFFQPITSLICGINVAFPVVISKTPWRRQQRLQKTMISLVEWGKITLLHVWHALLWSSQIYIVCQMTTWTFQIKVLNDNWTHNSKCLILSTYFNGASTSPIAACSVNKKACEEEPMITKSSPFPKCLSFRCWCRRCGPCSSYPSGVEAE